MSGSHVARASRPDPFAVLGLPASGEVTDDEVRAAWRRLAAATHPDRQDGGDPARFAAASAAYTILRTRSGRGEALAGLAAGKPARIGPPRARPPREAPVARESAPAPGGGAAGRPGPHPGMHAGPLARALARVAHGRPAVLAARLAVAVTAGVGSAALVGDAPATPALITGALTWLALTARHDLAPPGPP